MIEAKCTNCNGTGKVKARHDPEFCCPCCYGTGISLEDQPAYDKTEVPL